MGLFSWVSPKLFYNNTKWNGIHSTNVKYEIICLIFINLIKVSLNSSLKEPDSYKTLLNGYKEYNYDAETFSAILGIGLIENGAKYMNENFNQ